MSFERVDAATYRGTTTWAAPFDFPLSHDPIPLAPDCPYVRGASGPPGAGLVAVIKPTPAQSPAVLVVFDGRTVRRGC